MVEQCLFFGCLGDTFSVVIFARRVCMMSVSIMVLLFADCEVNVNYRSIRDCLKHLIKMAGETEI